MENYIYTTDYILGVDDAIILVYMTLYRTNR